MDVAAVGFSTAVIATVGVVLRSKGMVRTDSIGSKGQASREELARELQSPVIDRSKPKDGQDR